MAPYCYACGGTDCCHMKDKKKKKKDLTFEDTENNRMGYNDFTGRTD